jgi:hypothetical protein
VGYDDAMTATAAMGFLIIVLFVAATAPLWVAVVDRPLLPSSRSISSSCRRSAP